MDCNIEPPHVYVPSLCMAYILPNDKAFCTANLKILNEAKEQKWRVKLDTKTLSISLAAKDAKLRFNPENFRYHEPDCKFTGSEDPALATVNNSGKKVHIRELTCKDSYGIDYKTLQTCEDGGTANTCYKVQTDADTRSEERRVGKECR